MSETVSLKQYTDMQLACQQALRDADSKWLLLLHEADLRSITIAREADQRAQEATLAAMNLRLQGMNEFRKTIEDIINKTVTRNEAWGFLAGIVGIVVTALAFLMRG